MNDSSEVFRPYWLQTAAPFSTKSGLLMPPPGNPWPQTSPWSQPMPLVVPGPPDWRLLGGHGILSSAKPPRTGGGVLGQLMQPWDPSSLTQSGIRPLSGGPNDPTPVISDLTPDNEWIRARSTLVRDITFFRKPCGESCRLHLRLARYSIKRHRGTCILRDMKTTRLTGNTVRQPKNLWTNS